MKIISQQTFKVLTHMTVIAMTSLIVTAQQGTRLYLRFATNTTSSDTTGNFGVRIKQNENRDQYWLLGFGQNANSTALAQVDPSGTYPSILPQRHALASNASVKVSDAWDFDYNSNSELAVSAYQRDFTLLTVQPSLNISKYDGNLNPVGSSYYHMPTRSEYPGCAIKADNRNGCYVVVWNTIDPATVGNGTNLMDWGISKITQSTMAEVWSSAWTGPDAIQHEQARDVIIDQNGNYAVCGQRIDYTNNTRSGLVTVVNPVNGTLIWQRAYTPALGYALDLYCISNVLTQNGLEYVVSGTISPMGNPLTQTQAWLMGIDAATGNVTWRAALNISTDDLFGYRHCLMGDNGIVLAGKVNHRSGQPSSGMLLKFLNPSLGNNFPCRNNFGNELFQWLEQYDTKDADNAYQPVELFDVCSRITVNGASYTPDANHDVAAIGTASMWHDNTLIKDVLFLETESASSGGVTVHGRNNDLQPGGVQQHCLSIDDNTRNCSDIGISVNTLVPTKVHDFPDYSIAMSSYVDNKYRHCDPGTTTYYVGDSGSKGSPKESLSDYENSQIPVNELSISTVGMPILGDVCAVTCVTGSPCRGSVSIYDIEGRQVAMNAVSFTRPGTYNLDFSTVGWTSGVYFLQLNTESTVAVKMFTFIK